MYNKPFTITVIASGHPGCGKSRFLAELQACIEASAQFEIVMDAEPDEQPGCHILTMQIAMQDRSNAKP